MRGQRSFTLEKAVDACFLKLLREIVLVEKYMCVCSIAAAQNLAKSSR